MKIAFAQVRVFINRLARNMGVGVAGTGAKLASTKFVTTWGGGGIGVGAGRVGATNVHVGPGLGCLARGLGWPGPRLGWFACQG